MESKHFFIIIPRNPPYNPPLKIIDYTSIMQNKFTSAISPQYIGRTVNGIPRANPSISRAT